MILQALYDYYQRKCAAADAAEGTDFHATAAGHVALTPLKVDLTDHDALAYWSQGMKQMLEGAPR